MARRTRRTHRGATSGGLTQILLGGAIAGFVGSMVPYGNLGKLGVAIVGHKQGGIVGSAAKALGTIGVADIVQNAGVTIKAPTVVQQGGAW